MTACLEVATAYGDECVETSQCLAYLSIGGKCIDGVCNCDTGYHYLHGRCYKSSAFGEKCKTDDDCYVNWDSEALSCLNGICGCSEAFYQREYRTCRREANAVGAECTIDLDCRFDERAQCNQTAECYLSLKSEPNNFEDEMSNILFHEPRLLQNYPSKLQSDLTCTAIEDCVRYGRAVCTATGRCICERGFAFDSDGGYCIPELGEKCDQDSKAMVPNSKCRDGHWSCEGARIASANRRLCRKAATKFNPSCQYDEQCYVYGPDSLCVNRTCVCNEKSHYIEDEMFCWLNKGVRESCRSDKDCHVPNFRSKLICSESKCTCPKGTHLDLAGTGCADDVPVLGGLCSADEDCRPLSNVHCHEEKCSCIDAHFEASGACVAGINASCATDYDCKTQSSTCNESICICADGLVSPSPDLCVPVAEFDSECQYDIQCSASITDARCLKPEVAKPVASKFTGASSLNGTCNCAPSHHKKYKKCYSTRVLDETCHSRGECYVTSDPDSVRCLRGVCTCDFDAKRINSTFCQHDASATTLVTILLIPSMLFATTLIS
ncbi:tenascin-like isoform X2 [Venturia canescens]|nr:tenascin-like isoform X2 [Venturia canescens]XP_043267720.1 tenascin-like isoform X2 [Venturia canescens]